MWQPAGPDGPGTGGALIPMDLDATVVVARSEKEQAAPAWKRSFGFRPSCSFIDHGAAGTGEDAVLHLRKRNAGSNTAGDHIALTRTALAPRRPAPAGAGQDRLRRRHPRIPRLSGGPASALLDRVQPDRRPPDGDPRPARGHVRGGAWVAELTRMRDLTSWPKMRVIVRRERPHPGAQLRFTDLEGHRFTGFVTDTPWWHSSPTSNWARMLALHDHPARRWEPKRLRLRLFTTAGRLARSGHRLHLPTQWQWTGFIATAITRLQTLPAP